MIEVQVKDLTVKRLEELRQWLQDDRAQLFVECLRAEEAEFLAAALEKVVAQSADVCRGGPIPLTALAEFKKAATIRASIDLIDSKMRDESRLISATVIIS